MFHQLFFVLLALILINFAPETELTFWIQDPKQAFQWMIFIYICLLIGLYLQLKYLERLKIQRLKRIWLSCANIQALCFLGIYHFGFGGQHFFPEIFFSFIHTFSNFISLTLYFSILGWSYFWYAYFQLHYTFKTAYKFSWQQVLFFFPFCVPFMMAGFLIDYLEKISMNELFSSNVMLILLSLGLLGLNLMLLPTLMIICWQCRPLQRFDLKQRLEHICASLHFKYAGLKIWSSMQNTFTAGIIGVIPISRYILFTPALLNRFKVEEIEAILIHEIGHNRYKHLLLYPFILSGIIILSTISLLGLEKSLNFIFQILFYQRQISDFMHLTSLFICYAVLLAIYFRLIFGFFSRLFERQADLYIFETSISPVYMAQALDHLGVVTGYTHKQPNWQHFSLQERIRFLYQAMENSQIIQNHHQKVKKWLILYLCGLLLGIFILYVIS